MKRFELLDVVALTHDVAEHNLRSGDAGTIVELYDESNFDVEFVEPSGRTRALLALSSRDVRPVTPGEMLAVRSSQG